MANKNLTNAKRAKNDEFYTQYGDIQKEIEAYLEYNPDLFRGKVVYCNCDDPYESNFFRYFVLNFNKLGLKRLITTSYIPSPIAGGQLPLFEIEGLKPEGKEPFRIEINKVKDFDSDGAINLKDIEWLLKRDANVAKPLKGNGDFRSEECIDLLKQSDIVVTNPPFSLFREYVKQIFDYDKKFVIIGNMNAITYKEIFPLIKDNKMWLGNGFNAGNAYFFTPNTRDFASGVYDAKTGLVKFRNVCWFTNLDHGRRHRALPLMTIAENLKFSRHKEIKGKKVYDTYDNYDAIEVPFTDAIPSDYSGVMGVPISFLDKYSLEQFEILGLDDHRLELPKWRGRGPELNGKCVYRRVMIRHKKII
ncbi:MAG: adenine-specific methyltransferase EcoRI family protein [bacterium]